jgi:hypothetical protein
MTENIEKLTPIQLAQQKMQQMREAGIMPVRNPVKRFVENPKIGRAVKMFCYECNGYSRSAANNCENSDCPLWLFRRGKHSPDENELERWRENYTAHMTAAGEFTDSNDPEDDMDEEEVEEEVE